MRREQILRLGNVLEDRDIISALESERMILARARMMCMALREHSGNNSLSGGESSQVN